MLRLMDSQLYLHCIKCPKSLNTLFIRFLSKSLLLKILSGMANSVDSDTVWSGCALFACAILLKTLLYKILRHLPYVEIATGNPVRG